MPNASQAALEPRKTPMQARSAASVAAILEATVQVLRAVGKERLTTTRVAARAGVSVGTLYQYFPNKSALLQACLTHHIDGVRQALESVCREHRSAALLDIGTAVVTGYLDAKMRDPEESATLYSVSSDVDGAAIAKAATAQSQRAVAELFATAKEGLTKDPVLIAKVVLAALNGTARMLLDTRSPQRELPLLRDELLTLVHAYLRTCTASPLP